LTVARLVDRRVTVAVVPHTLRMTTLGDRPVGAPINVETDVIGKYVLRALGRMGAGSRGGGLTLDTLAKYGFTS
jgi:riboflavin synthase